jgi:RNA polymerase sigma-70 factor (ECF subfamily)
MQRADRRVIDPRVPSKASLRVRALFAMLVHLTRRAERMAKARTTSRPPSPATPPPPSPTVDRRQESRDEDSVLIRRAIEGDQRSFRRLRTKYHDAIFNLISRMIRSRAEVEDLTQEAFIKAFQSLRHFNEEFAFSTWLYKIATNNCIDYIRKRKLQMYSINKPIESKDSDFTFELPDEGYEADRELIDDQRARMLREAIDELPEKYRRVIQLRHVDEKSYEEIAAMLKLPIGTVKAHIFRAREMLYKQLKHQIRHY